MHSNEAGRQRLKATLVVIPFLLALFGAWVWNLGYSGFTEDEAFVTRMAQQPVADILRRLNTDEPHPALFYLSMRVWRYLFDSNLEFVVRLPAVLLGVIVLSLTYRLGRDLGLGISGALTAVLLLGLNPQITIHIREMRMYGPMIATLAGAALISWRFPRLPARLAIPIAAAAFLIALLTHYFNVLFILALGAWGLVTFKGATRRRWIIAQAVALTVLAAWLPLLGRGFFNPISLTAGKWWSSILPPWETLSRIAEVGVFGYRDYAYQPLAWAGGVCLAAVWLIGALSAQGRVRWFLFSLVALPLVSYSLLCWLRPVFHPKYTLPWLFFAALAGGVLVARRSVPGLSVGLALIIGMAVPLWRTWRMPYEPVLSIAYDDWQNPTARELARTLVAVSAPTDVFGLGTPDWSHCYYSDEYFPRHMGCALLPADPAQTAAELGRQVDQLLDAHRVLWFLDYYNPAWDPNHLADDVLTRRALSLGDEETAERRLRLYVSPATVLREQQPVKARFGDAAELQGIWWMPGRALHLVLVFKSLAHHPAGDAKVFAQLLDESGQIVAQDDSIPVQWTRPLDTWRLNEQLLDVHTLPLPAGACAAGCSLNIGLYAPATLTRLPAYDPNQTRLAEDAVSISLTLPRIDCLECR